MAYVAQRDDVLFVSYEALCEDPQAELQRLADVLGVTNGNALMNGGGGARSPRMREVDVASVDPSLIRDVHSLHDALRSAAS